MSENYDILIVGAGHAGAQAAIALRQGGHAGSIGLIGEDPDPPYERPPLSKEYLLGEKSFERILLRPAGFWSERAIDLLPGRRVVSVEPEAHRVTTSEGRSLGYGKLIWATGGVPRRLACDGADLAGVHTIRCRADVDRMMAELGEVRRVAIVGGGYIGLEAASALRKLGKEVVLIEALDRVLARVAGEPLSRFFEAEHRAHGVDLRLGVTVDRILGRAGRVAGLGLAGGGRIEAEMVVVGIGIIPAIEPLVAAGAEAGNGVRVDAQCRTSLADIFAIGDCALHANPFADEALIRLESVQNANDQANVAARTILGEAVSYHAIPWFWSNQYDLKLQTVGISAGHDQTVIRGDPATRSFSILYLKSGRVIALDCVNCVRDYVQGRALILSRAEFPAERLGDPTEPLKALAMSAAA